MWFMANGVDILGVTFFFLIVYLSDFLDGFLKGYFESLGTFSNHLILYQISLR